MILFLTKKEARCLSDSLESRFVDLMRELNNTHITVPPEDREMTIRRIYKEMNRIENLKERLKWYE